MNLRLLADTGAGTSRSVFELLLDEQDCLMCGGIPNGSVGLRGAFTGTHPVYSIRVAVANLGFNQAVSAVGVPSVPVGFDGIAGFAFLNRFTFGNFADQARFGLES